MSAAWVVRLSDTPGPLLAHVLSTRTTAGGFHVALCGTRGKTWVPQTETYRPGAYAHCSTCKAARLQAERGVVA